MSFLPRAIGGGAPRKHLDLTPADVARLDPAGARDAALALLDRSADHLADDVRGLFVP